MIRDQGRGAQRGDNPWQDGEDQPAAGYSRTSPQGYEGAALKLVEGLPVGLTYPPSGAVIAQEP